MKIGIFSVHDKLVGYKPPFTDVSKEVANRSFVNSVLAEYDESPVSTMFDMSLYQVGSFDTDTGLIEKFDSPEFINSGVLIINMHIAKEG